MQTADNLDQAAVIAELNYISSRLMSDLPAHHSMETWDTMVWNVMMSFDLHHGILRQRNHAGFPMLSDLQVSLNSCKGADRTSAYLALRH